MSRYEVFITPTALRAVKDLPGHVRQRVKRAIDDLQENASPPGSKALDLSNVEIAAEVEGEVRRLRIDKWRVLYVVTEADRIIDVLAIRKRPPYDYGDLSQLLGEKE